MGCSASNHSFDTSGVSTGECIQRNHSISSPEGFLPGFDEKNKKPTYKVSSKIILEYKTKEDGISKHDTEVVLRSVNFIKSTHMGNFKIEPNIGQFRCFFFFSIHLKTTTKELTCVCVYYIILCGSFSIGHYTCVYKFRVVD